MTAWSHRIQTGMWAWTKGTAWSEPQWRVQVYWPEIKIRRREIHLVFRTIFRLLWTEEEVGFGFQLAGFGVGAARASAGVVANLPAAPQQENPR